jgi:hypothetical protein
MNRYQPKASNSTTQKMLPTIALFDRGRPRLRTTATAHVTSSNNAIPQKARSRNHIPLRAAASNEGNLRNLLRIEGSIHMFAAVNKTSMPARIHDRRTTPGILEAKVWRSFFTQHISTGDRQSYVDVTPSASSRAQARYSELKSYTPSDNGSRRSVAQTGNC